MKRKESVVELSKEQKENSAVKIKEYMAESFDIEISVMQSKFLVDFITENIGVYYYNIAIADSLKFMTEKVDDLYLLMKDEEE